MNQAWLARYALSSLSVNDLGSSNCMPWHHSGYWLMFYFSLEDGVDVARVINGSRFIESLL